MNPSPIGENPAENSESPPALAPGLRGESKIDPLSDRIRAALAALPDGDREGVARHMLALAKLSPRKRAAICSLTD